MSYDYDYDYCSNDVGDYYDVGGDGGDYYDAGGDGGDYYNAGGDGGDYYNVGGGFCDGGGDSGDGGDYYDFGGGFCDGGGNDGEYYSGGGDYNSGGGDYYVGEGNVGEYCSVGGDGGEYCSGVLEVVDYNNYSGDGDFGEHYSGDSEGPPHSGGDGEIGDYESTVADGGEYCSGILEVVDYNSYSGGDGEVGEYYSGDGEVGEYYSGDGDVGDAGEYYSGDGDVGEYYSGDGDGPSHRGGDEESGDYERSVADGGAYCSGDGYDGHYSGDVDGGEYDSYSSSDEAVGDYNSYSGGIEYLSCDVDSNSYSSSSGVGTYVDNSMNRSLGRVGLPYGSAVYSTSANSSSYSNASADTSSSGTYVDNEMNRSLGRVGLPNGSAVHSSSGNSSSYVNSNGNESETYVDNQINRSLGRVGLPHGSAVHSTSRNSSAVSNSSADGSSNDTYVENQMNRSLGRVGLPHGSAVHSRSYHQSGHSVAGGWESSSNNAAQVYADNQYNRRLGRVGLPLGTANVTSSAHLGHSTIFSSSGSSGASARRYVDNPMNRHLGRVGMIVGTQPVPSRSAAPASVELGFENIYRPLVRLDAEDDNLGDIMTELVQLRNEVRVLNGNRDREMQCETAIGIVNRHEAALTKYQNKLKVPEWVRGGQVIPFESLELGDKIGGGGFGDVHSAFWHGNVVAVKKLRVQRVSQAKKQEFQAEVQVFSQLDHPAIVKFFGVCTTSPNLAIVMEFMGGGSMHDILHIEQRVLSTTQKEQMITDCLEALKYLHARNVTHRDIKSLNILICDDYEHCKLGDFGLAMKEDARASSSVVDHGAVGTLPYSPLEVIEGRRLKLDEMKCVDVYSMGIVIVEFLTNRIPFKGLNQHQIRQSIRNGLRPNAESISDASLKTLLETALSQESERRPSARAFLRTWEELKLIGSMNRMSIVDVNASSTAGSSGGTGGLPSYLADVLNTSEIRSSSSESHSSSSTTRNSSSSSRRLECPMCLENSVNAAFVCGHLVCDSCLPNLTMCPVCRGSAQNPIRIYF